MQISGSWLPEPCMSFSVTYSISSSASLKESPILGSVLSRYTDVQSGLSAAIPLFEVFDPDSTHTLHCPDLSLRTCKPNIACLQNVISVAMMLNFCRGIAHIY